MADQSSTTSNPPIPVTTNANFNNNINDKVHKSPSQGAQPNVTSFNPRSCVTCRRRKVKCNKSHPCSNCVKAHIDCIYPAPGRAPRRPRKPPDAELLARLRRLEGVVKGLGVPVDENDPNHVASPASEPAKDSSRWSPASSGMSGDATKNSKITNDFGRLVINEGRSRYVNNPVWATLSSEVQDLKGILDESSSDESSYPSPSSTDPVSPPRDGFVFGMSSTIFDLGSLVPSPEKIALYWEVYKERCDLVMKTLHIPTVSEIIQNVISNGGKASKGTEALMFSIYLAAVTSLTPELCQEMFGEDRNALIARFRYGTEQALSRAHFLVTEEIQVLQAFVIMLVCLRRVADPRAIWSLCGLACRIALTIGLHRDGTNFGITPFETEMRRRVWWQVFLLDTRSSEDHGTDPSISETSFDTQLPSNVNDEDLTPSMDSFPEPRQGFTAMSFCLLRYEIATSFRKFRLPQMPGLPLDQLSTMSADDKQRIIEECHQHLEERYLRHFNPEEPIQYLCCTVARLIMAKQWIVLYHPSERTEDGSNGALSSTTLDKIFITCVESLEYVLALARQPKVDKWRWMFLSYNQWHPLVFLLSELKRRTRGPNVERAWRAVDASVVSFGEAEDDKKKGHLWKPLQKLIAAARIARQRQIVADQRASKAQKMANGGRGASLQQPLNNQNLELLGASTDGRMNAQMGAMGMEIKGSAGNSPTMNIAPFDTANLSRSVGQQIPNSYVWDNISSNVPAHSQFFANQPQIPASQWQEMTNGASMVMNDWFNDFSAMQGTGTNNSHVNSTAATPASHNDVAFTGAPNPSGFVGNGVAGAPGDDMRRLSAGASPPLGSNFSDPMLSGSEDGAVQWEDWDAMIREFDYTAGGAGQAPWGRRPVMGETWL